MTVSSEMTAVVGHVVESEPVLGNVVQSQPHGSYNNTKYMASPGKIEEFRSLKTKWIEVFVPLNQHSVKLLLEMRVWGLSHHLGLVST